MLMTYGALSQAVGLAGHEDGLAQEDGHPTDGPVLRRLREELVQLHSYGGWDGHSRCLALPVIIRRT